MKVDKKVDRKVEKWWCRSYEGVVWLVDAEGKNRELFTRNSAQSFVWQLLCWCCCYQDWTLGIGVASANNTRSSDGRLYLPLFRWQTSWDAVHVIIWSLSVIWQDCIWHRMTDLPTRCQWPCQWRCQLLLIHYWNRDLIIFRDLDEAYG